MKQSDVVVVGAGPAGTAAAILLARKGYDVTLIDRKTFPRDKACGEFFNPAACDLIDGLFGLSRGFLESAGARPIDGIRLQLRRGPVDIPLIDAERRAISGLAMRRQVADSLFVRACREAGVNVRENVNVRSCARVGESILIAGLDGAGAPVEFCSRLVVAADGTQSVLARQLGLTIPVRWLQTIGLAAHLQGISERAVRDRYVWMFPSNRDGVMFGFCLQEGGKAGWSASVPKTMSRRIAADPVAFVRDRLERYPELEDLSHGADVESPVVTTACFGHRLKRCFDDGILFVGDAARFSDPFTGEGIHHALESAVLASRVAETALSEGDTSARKLSPYEAERRELRSRYSLCELVRAVCLRPRLLEFIGNRLRTRERLAETLVAVLADVLPTRAVFNPAFLIRAMAP